MLIIIEGADCTGKTTLARALMETDVENGMTYITKGPPVHKNPIREYLWPLSKYVPGDGFHYICDRWHIGEMVYPSIFNRESILTAHSFKLIDDVIARIGGLVVYLNPPFNVVERRYEKRGDKLIKNNAQLYDAYKEFNTVYEHDLIKNTNIIQYTGVIKTDYAMKQFTECVITHARIYEKAAMEGITL